MPPNKPGHHHHAVGFESDPRDRSSSQEWEESNALDDSRSLSSQKSDGGYHSSGPSSSFDHGGYNPMSSMRSVGSTGSQGSTRGMGHVAVASHLVNGETKFPTAMSYASDAVSQRSDVATVCSGSVVEDIEVESVISADLNVQSTANVNANPTSPPSSVIKMPVNKPSNSSGNVQFAGSGESQKQQPNHETVVPPKGLPVLAVQPQEPPLALHNDMGPPLSRSLLLQHPQHHTEGNSSQAGSVKSFESNTGSDVVAHVDTDDCGGSLDMDVHSIHSQEDVAHPEGNDTNKTTNPEDKKEPVNPLLCSNESTTNGRTSPGGTIYKGRGNRRYEGRFMRLPLKRFHQNGVDLGDADPPTNTTAVEGNNGITHHASKPEATPPHPSRNGGWDTAAQLESRRGRGRSRSRSPQQHPRDNFNRRHYSNGCRQRSRSRSRSRSRDRESDRERNNTAPKYDAYDNRKPRARRWQHNGENGNVYRSHSHSRNRGESNGYNTNANYKGYGGRGNHRRR